MSSMKTRKQSKIVVALVAVTGLTAASQTGLLNQVVRVLDSNLVPVAGAQKVPRNAERIPVNLMLREYDAERLTIKDGEALLRTDNGEMRPLPDGIYQFPDSAFQGDRWVTVKDGRVASCSAEMQGSVFCGDDDGGPWILEMPDDDDGGDDEAIRRPNVQDTMERVRDRDLITPRPNPQPRPEISPTPPGTVDPTGF